MISSSRPPGLGETTAVVSKGGPKYSTWWTWYGQTRQEPELGLGTARAYTVNSTPGPPFFNLPSNNTEKVLSKCFLMVGSRGACWAYSYPDQPPDTGMLAPLGPSHYPPDLCRVPFMELLSL